LCLNLSQNTPNMNDEIFLMRGKLMMPEAE
jgi:hypothetical protein